MVKCVLELNADVTAVIACNKADKTIVNGEFYMIDLEQAMLDPARVFPSPADVVHQAGLSREQKIEILRRWEYDARQLQVATEENMGGNSDDLLDRVLDALHKLGAEYAQHNEAPTKQGGV